MEVTNVDKVQADTDREPPEMLFVIGICHLSMHCARSSMAHVLAQLSSQSVRAARTPSHLFHRH